MKTDQDLIFEAYNKTLNEDYQDPASGKLDDDLMPIKNKSGFENFYAEGESFADKLSDEGLEFAIKNLNQLKGILMDEFGYRRQKGFAEDNENYNDVGVLEQLEIFMQKNPETSQELAPILNELLEIAEELVKFDEFMDGEAQDEYLYLLNKLSTTAKT